MYWYGTYINIIMRSKVMAAVCLFQYHTNTNEQILTGLSLFGSLESNIKPEVRTLCLSGRQWMYTVQGYWSFTELHALPVITNAFVKTSLQIWGRRHVKFLFCSPFVLHLKHIRPEPNK